MKVKLYRFALVITTILIYNVSQGQIIGDSIISFSNNWNIGESVEYESISYKQKIINGDTITQGVSPLDKTKVSLIETLQSNDKIFEIKTETPDKSIGNLGRLEPFRRYYEAALKISEKPTIFLTNADGSIKDILGYDDLINKLDSLELILLQCCDSLDWEKEIKDNILQSTINQFRESLSKQSIIDQCQFLQLYGNSFPIGTSYFIEETEIPFLDNQEIEASTELVCEILDNEPNCQIVSLNYS